MLHVLHQNSLKPVYSIQQFIIALKLYNLYYYKSISTTSILSDNHSLLVDFQKKEFSCFRFKKEIIIMF